MEQCFWEYDSFRPSRNYWHLMEPAVSVQFSDKPGTVASWGHWILPPSPSVMYRCSQFVRLYSVTGGAMAEWCWRGKAEVLGEKRVSVPLCTSQFPHGLALNQSWTSSVRGCRQTAWPVIFVNNLAKLTRNYFSCMSISIPVTAVARCLRCCATNRKAVGSTPDGVIGIFHWRNPSGRTMALGVDSASNRNEYQEHFLGVKAAGA